MVATKQSYFPLQTTLGTTKHTTCILQERNTLFHTLLRKQNNHSETGVIRQGQSIWSNPIVAVKNVFYVFGGDGYNSPTKTIAAFNTKTKEWHKAGELNYARYGHGVIIHKDEFVVVGGIHTPPGVGFPGYGAVKEFKVIQIKLLKVFNCERLKPPKPPRRLT